ncbi:MAG: hypothetical protein LiPW30_748 [Parcubacteria group bacterium LiPW_30]|nr:MAG: hypothetical protein LiPW30_748 [Parcubacteria group bacterium LiPW_30]
MNRQGNTSAYTTTINVWNYPVGIYHFYISVSDESVPPNSKTYTDVSWKFDKLSTCNSIPPAGDNTPPTIASPNVVFDCDTNKATTTATITDDSTVASALVIFKNFAGDIVSTAVMTNAGSIYTQIMDVANYPVGVYTVYISATDNSPNKNNGITNVGSFGTRYVIDSFTVNPTSAVAGAKVGTPLTLTAHMSCDTTKTAGEKITFTDDTDPSVVIGEATVGANGNATFSPWKIATFIKGIHTLRAAHAATGPPKNLPASFLTTTLNVTAVPVCATAQSGEKICIYISNIANSSQLNNFTITAAGVTYTKTEYEANSDLLSFRAGVVRAGVTTGPQVVLTVHLAGTSILSDEIITFTDQTDDNIILGTAVTNASGIATLSYYPPVSQKMGRHIIIATYGGSPEKGYKPSYKENYLNESIGVCSYVWDGNTQRTSGDRICVYLSFLNSETMTSFIISPTTVIAGKNTGTVRPGTLVTFTASLPGQSGKTVTFIDQTQEFVIGKYITVNNLNSCIYGNYSNTPQNIVIGTAVTNASGIATLTYRFPYAIRDPGYRFYSIINLCQYVIGADNKFWPPRLMSEKQGTHKIIAVYAGSTTQSPSWITSSLNLNVPGTCTWFPNQFSSYMQPHTAPGSGYGEVFCSAISNKPKTAAPPPPPYISP